MSVDYKCRQIYNDVIHDVTKTEEAWKSVLSLCGRIYRYEFDNILMVYAQRPKSTLVADYDTWKKVDRYVKRGSKGIAIYPSRALAPHCRYVFDISDTGGRNVNLTWSLDGDNLTGYAKRLAGEGNIIFTGDESLGELKNEIWDFTKSEIRGILKEIHAMRAHVLADKLGNQIISGMQDIRDDGMQIIERSIFYLMSRAERGVKDILLVQVNKAEEKVQELHYNKLMEAKENLKSFASDTVKKFKMIGNKALLKAVDITHIRQALIGIRDKADRMVGSIDSLSDMVEGYKVHAEYEAEHRGKPYKEDSYQQDQGSVSTVAEESIYQESEKTLSYEEEMKKFMADRVSEGVTYECNQDAYEDFKAYYDKKMKSDSMAGVNNSLSKGSEQKSR